MYNQNELLGEWINFEEFIDSQNENMILAWNEAEEVGKNMPMFKCGVKAFWKYACKTTTKENIQSIQKWLIKQNKDALEIEWILKDSSFKDVYYFEKTIEKGLENKENYLFVGEKESPFRYLLAMPPMPSKEAYNQGELLPHLHYQYASNLNDLYDNELKQKSWYPTMVYHESSTVLEECNIVRALHHLPLWDKLPK